jgi:molybdopterin molybdotransferase
MAAMVEDSSTQRIRRLTPLAAVLALIEERVGAVQPGRCALPQALGCTLAQDVAVALLPPAPIAMRDGFAVEAAAIADASSYAPVPFAAMPRRIDVGETLPEGTDTVLPLDAVTLRGDRAEAIAAAAPGDGVLLAGGDAAAGMPLRRAGQRLRAIDLAVMAAAGISEAMVRAPRVCLACGSAAKTAPIEAALTFLARAGWSAGAEMLDSSRTVSHLEAALTSDRHDAIIVVGGTGSGTHDAAVQALAHLGRVELHGIAVSPGETAAFGFVGARPVLLVPGRLDAALAIWLLVGRHLIGRLAAAVIKETPAMLPLKRKVTSSIGLTELVPVAVDGGMAAPLAANYLSFQTLTRSDGYIVIAADSEGFAAGTPVAVWQWP